MYECPPKQNVVEEEDNDEIAKLKELFLGFGNSYKDVKKEN